MALTRSDEAVQGSVESSSDSKRTPDPSYASTRVHQYCQDTTVPVNAHLGLAPPEQLVTSHERANLGIVGSINNILDKRQPNGRLKGETPAPGATYASTNVDVRCAGTRFGGVAQTRSRLVDVERTAPIIEK